jgi:hypothetical protein
MKFDIKMFFEFIANTLKDILKKNENTFLDIRNEFVPEQGVEVLYPMLYLRNRSTREDISGQRLKDAIWAVLQELPEFEMIAEMKGINIASELDKAEQTIRNIINAKKIVITPGRIKIYFHIYENNLLTHQNLNIEALWTLLSKN